MNVHAISHIDQDHVGGSDKIQGREALKPCATRALEVYSVAPIFYRLNDIDIEYLIQSLIQCLPLQFIPRIRQL
jgi:hypothetical protein